MSNIFDFFNINKKDSKIFENDLFNKEYQSKLSFKSESSPKINNTKNDENYINGHILV